MLCHMNDDLVHHRMMTNTRVTDPGLPPPVPPARGPSSYSAASFNSFGVGNMPSHYYGHPPRGPPGPGSYIYAPPSANHYETASIYQEHFVPRHDLPRGTNY